jgi:uncharacterized membrane protein
MKLTPYILIAFTFVGLAVTAYLSYFAFNNLIPSCSIGGCAVVLTSTYSKFLGLPLAYLGLVYYVYMFALALLVAMDPNSRTLKLAVLAYTAVGLALSAYFEFYIQGILIGSYCEYCAISAITTLLLFGTAVWHWRTKNSIA